MTLWTKETLKLQLFLFSFLTEKMLVSFSALGIELLLQKIQILTSQRKKSFENIMEEKKMLVTTIFFFLQSVFYHPKDSCHTSFFCCMQMLPG